MKLNHFVSMLKKDQPTLKKYLSNKLKSFYPSEQIKNDAAFLYAAGTLPVMLVAHLDTVHRTLPQIIACDEKRGVLWSAQGIGGDDRCGVYAILSVLERFRAENRVYPHVLFTTDEETGGRGATAASNELEKPDVKFLIEIDRRGDNDAVFYSCGNEDFQSMIQEHGFEKSFGSFSDISILSPAWDIASVNLSSGYYNAHTSNEYIMMAHLEKTISRICDILRGVNDQTPAYDYQRTAPVVSSKWTSGMYGGCSSYPVYRTGVSQRSLYGEDLVTLAEKRSRVNVNQEKFEEEMITEENEEDLIGDLTMADLADLNADELFALCDDCSFENPDYNCAGCSVYTRLCEALCEDDVSDEENALDDDIIDQLAKKYGA